MCWSGHSVCCHVHGFEPYFYIACPAGMNPDDISSFHKVLEVYFFSVRLNIFLVFVWLWPFFELRQEWEKPIRAVRYPNLFEGSSTCIRRALCITSSLNHNLFSRFLLHFQLWLQAVEVRQWQLISLGISTDILCFSYFIMFCLPYNDTMMMQWIFV